MTPELLDYLCDPKTKEPLTLVDPVYDDKGRITSGKLVSTSGSSFPIINGIPRFVPSQELANTVESFGVEWNYFNYTSFKEHWLKQAIKHTFGSTDVFKNKLIVDAGCGSGAQSLWMLEYGAKHVISLDLSDSVDDVVQSNLRPSGLTNYDVIQCSIDQPPIKDQCIELVYCHNVIQHTPSVERTAKALFKLVASKGELIFNCYRANDKGILRWIRAHIIYSSLRKLFNRLPFSVILGYAKIMGCLRLLPFLGWFLEKSGFCLQGAVPRTGSFFFHLGRRYEATVHNTYDLFGFHAFQHYKSNSEIRELLDKLQPDSSKVLNTERYFTQPPPVGIALRIFR